MSAAKPYAPLLSEMPLFFRANCLGGTDTPAAQSSSSLAASSPPVVQGGPFDERSQLEGAINDIRIKIEALTQRRGQILEGVGASVAGLERELEDVEVCVSVPESGSTRTRLSLSGEIAKTKRNIETNEKGLSFLRKMLTIMQDLKIAQEELGRTFKDWEAKKTEVQDVNSVSERASKDLIAKEAGDLFKAAWERSKQLKKELTQAKEELPSSLEITDDDPRIVKWVADKENTGQRLGKDLEKLEAKCQEVKVLVLEARAIQKSLLENIDVELSAERGTYDELIKKLTAMDEVREQERAATIERMRQEDQQRISLEQAKSSALTSD